MTLFNLKIKDKNWSCMSVDKDCPCSINLVKSVLIPSARIDIKSCNNEISLSIGITSAKLFVATEKGVFFPIVESYGYKEEDKYSDVLNIKSLEYGFVSWQP